MQKAKTTPKIVNALTALTELFVTGNPLGKSSSTSPKIRNYMPIECPKWENTLFAFLQHHLSSLVVEGPQQEPVFLSLMEAQILLLKL